jgi:hypothetical protein
VIAPVHLGPRFAGCGRILDLNLNSALDHGVDL